MNIYQVVHFYDEFYGVEVLDGPEYVRKFVEPKKEHRWFKSYIVGKEEFWSTPECVEEWCFMSLEDAIYLCDLLNGYKQKQDTLDYAVANAVPVDEDYLKLVSGNSG